MSENENARLRADVEWLRDQMPPTTDPIAFRDRERVWGRILALLEPMGGLGLDAVAECIGLVRGELGDDARADEAEKEVRGLLLERIDITTHDQVAVLVGGAVFTQADVDLLEGLCRAAIIDSGRDGAYENDPDPLDEVQDLANRIAALLPPGDKP